jgi:hypothetical protein
LGGTHYSAKALTKISRLMSNAEKARESNLFFLWKLRKRVS